MCLSVYTSQRKNKYIWLSATDTRWDNIIDITISSKPIFFSEKRINFHLLTRRQKLSHGMLQPLNISALLNIIANYYHGRMKQISAYCNFTWKAYIYLWYYNEVIYIKQWQKYTSIDNIQDCMIFCNIFISEHLIFFILFVSFLFMIIDKLFFFTS